MWKFAIGIFNAGSGYSRPNLEIIVPGTDLREREDLTSVIDVAILPKAICGDAVSVEEETGEVDECYCRGVKFGGLSGMVRKIWDESLVTKREETEMD